MRDGLMGTSVLGPAAASVLEELHELAERTDGQVLRGLVASDYDWWGSTAEENATACRDAPLAVAPEAGLFLYGMVRAICARAVVEFGTSFGVSTIYIAAALRDNGGGVVVTTELDPSKVLRARQNLARAGLTEFAQVLEGDARQTLKGSRDAIDLLFLDGWKNLYLEVLKVVLPNLRPGAVVVADDLFLEPEDVQDYLAFVRDPANGFMSVTLMNGEGREFSVKV
jgi:predicted O-methyltransferase YrrM